MRDEIVKAIRNVNSLSEKKQAIGPGEMPSGDYSFNLSQSEQNNLKRLSGRLKRLKICLESLLDPDSIHIGTATSLEIQGKTLSSQVVIELSLYGPLAVVFVYGEISELTLQHIDKCISVAGLTRLADEERVSLENKGMYRKLF